MSDIFGSVVETVEEKIKTPVYGTFLIWFLVVHSKFIITLFFVSEDKIWEAHNHILKSDYLYNTFFDYTKWSTWIYWILPFILTFLTIWIFPKLFLMRAYRKIEEHEAEKLIDHLKAQDVVEKARKTLLQTETETLKAIDQKNEQEKQITEKNPSVLWNQEYKDLENTKFYKDFDLIIESIYEHGGNTKWGWDSRAGVYEREIPTRTLVFFDANGLVDLEGDDNSIRLTDKGRYFIKQYTNKMGTLLKPSNQ